MSGELFEFGPSRALLRSPCAGRSTARSVPETSGEISRTLFPSRALPLRQHSHFDDPTRLFEER